VAHESLASIVIAFRPDASCLRRFGTACDFSEPSALSAEVLGVIAVEDFETLVEQRES
jgi:hypothetical protein